MKKLQMIGLALLLVMSFGLAGCGSGGSEKVKLTVAAGTADQATRTAMQEIITAFEKENPDIDVAIEFPGKNYENLMKMKMASNDLPDLFDTHGWAKVRYGKYLMDLSGEPWADDLTDSIKPVITDDQGKVYVFPLNESKEGLTYNVKVLEKYNIDPPETFDDLLDAAEKIKTESKGEVLPFFVSDFTISSFFGSMANPLFITSKNNEADNLLDGSFDWNKWTYLPEKFKEMYEKGYLNNDLLTAKHPDESRLFAENKLAFVFHGPTSYSDVKAINPDAKLGVMPIPSIHPGDEPTFTGGERYTFGVWKDTKHPKEAKKLLQFFAQPENVKKMADVTMSPAGLKTVKGGGELSSYYEKYKENRTFPYFDRVYLPNGMWDVMGTNAQQLIAGDISPKQYSENMKKEVERLQKK